MNILKIPLYINSLLRSAGLSPLIADFATAQSAHETAGFTSQLLKENNNLFGMTYAGQILAKGEKNGFAYYDNIEDSVSDWLKWYQAKRNNILSLPLYINSVESFVRFLKRNNYFEADESEYLKGVTYFYNQLFT